MCALVIKSAATADLTSKARKWGLIDQLRWEIECLAQRIRGEV